MEKQKKLKDIMDNIQKAEEELKKVQGEVEVKCAELNKRLGEKEKEREKGVKDPTSTVGGVSPVEQGEGESSQKQPVDESQKQVDSPPPSPQNQNPANTTESPKGGNPELEKRRRAYKLVDDLFAKIDKDTELEKELKDQTTPKLKISLDVKTTEFKKIEKQSKTLIETALPALQDAMTKIAKLKMEDVIGNGIPPQPPPKLQLAMEVVCTLFNMRDPSNWKTQKEFLQDRSFPNNLRDFDKDNIMPKAIKKIKPYCDDEGKKAHEFQPEDMKKCGIWFEALCVWCRAMYIYDAMANKLGPVKHKMRQMEPELEVLCL